MFIYQSRFLTRGEVWFDDEPDGTRVDWVFHRQRSLPLANCKCEAFYTRVIDLRKAPAELLAGMEKNTARKIIDAQEKDRLQWERCDARNPKTLDEVERMWNEFAIAQKTARFDRGWMDQISKSGSLEVSAAKDPAGNVLAYHLVFITMKRARQLIAISPYRSSPDVTGRGAVNRANCFIHWKNFLFFKERGIQSFDFGGWYTGTTNIQYLGMNQFKKSFGGQVICEFDCEEIRTAKGWIMLNAARFLKRTGLFKIVGAPIGAPPKTNRNGKPHETSKNREVSPKV